MPARRRRGRLPTQHDDRDTRRRDGRCPSQRAPRGSPRRPRRPTRRVGRRRRPTSPSAEEAAAREAAAEAAPRPATPAAARRSVKPEATTSRKVADRRRSRGLEGRRRSRRLASEGGLRPRPQAALEPARPPRRPSRPPRPRSRGPSPRPSTSARAGPTGSTPRTSTSAGAASAGPSATDIAVSQGGIGLARGERVSRRAGRRRRGARRARSASPRAASARSSPARCTSSSRSSGRSIANEVQADRTTGVLLLLARRVDGDVEDDARLARRARVRGGLRDRLDAPAPPQALVTSSCAAHRDPDCVRAPGRGWQGGRSTASERTRRCVSAERTGQRSPASFRRDSPGRAAAPAIPRPVIDPSARVHATADLEPDVSVGAGTSIWHRAQVRTGATDRRRVRHRPRRLHRRGRHRSATGSRSRTLALIYHGVTVEDGVFIGPGAILTNDRYPRAITSTGDLARADDWEVSPDRARATAARSGPGRSSSPASTSAGSRRSGPAAVVTRTSPNFALVVGSPAQRIGWVCACGAPARSTANGDPAAAEPRPLRRPHAS